MFQFTTETTVDLTDYTRQFFTEQDLLYNELPDSFFIYKYNHKILYSQKLEKQSNGHKNEGFF